MQRPILTPVPGSAGAPPFARSHISPVFLPFLFNTMHQITHPSPSAHPLPWNRGTTCPPNHRQIPNRKNSKKSSGPRTAEGKARSSRNSTVHGLTGKSPILPGEDPADLLDLAERYHADLKPDGAVEEDLVERMAVATYRLRRIARIEVGYFDLRLRYHPMPEQL